MTHSRRLRGLVYLVGLALCIGSLAGCEQGGASFSVSGPSSDLVVCQRDKKPVMVEFYINLKPGQHIRSIDGVELLDAKNVELADAALTEWALEENGQLISLGDGFPIGKGGRVYGLELNEKDKLVQDVPSTVLWKDRQSFPTGQVGPLVEDEPAPLLTVVLKVSAEEEKGKIGGISVQYTDSVGLSETTVATSHVEVFKDKYCGEEPEERPEDDD